MAALTSEELLTSLPSTDTIRSPSFKPALSAAPPFTICTMYTAVSLSELSHI